MRFKLSTLLACAVLLLTTGCREFLEFLDEVQPRKMEVKEFASGLASPIGLAVDLKGNVWVTEIGTGNNDGKVSMITEDGTKHTVIEGFPSIFDPGEGISVGLNHLLVKDGTLWILHAFGQLYKFDLHSHHAGDAPVKASELEKEEIGKFVLDYEFEEDADESNPYNLVAGPEGDLFITDAAANAIIRRHSDGHLSVFATIPNLENPTQVGPPMINSVPTGIAYDGYRFFVSSLTGFPFPAGKARLYQVNLSGEVSVYREGFTTMVDVIIGSYNRPFVVEYAQFGEQGFTPNTGRLVRVTEDAPGVLLDKLNLPTSIARHNASTYYINSLADGKIKKLTYVY